MTTNKPLVFISHISEEKEIAIAFKELIENSFLGLLEIFVSSDINNIQMGQKWLDQISNALKQCKIEIILCSNKSIEKPWINFEAGAGWVRDIPVIPLCHSGMEPSKLPMPLNLLQAATAKDVSSLKSIIPVLAKAIGATTPTIDFSNFIAKVTEFENCLKIEACSKHMGLTERESNDLLTLSIDVLLAMHEMNELRVSGDGFIQIAGLLTSGYIRRSGITVTPAGGVYTGNYGFKLTEKGKAFIEAWKAGNQRKAIQQDTEA